MKINSIYTCKINKIILLYFHEGMIIMNETLKTIESRRSIRRYRQEQIADAELEQIINAAIYAPSAVNQQKWRFTVIQNKEMLDRMVGIIKTNIISANAGFLAQRAVLPDYNTFSTPPRSYLFRARAATRGSPSTAAWRRKTLPLFRFAVGWGAASGLARESVMVSSLS
jgi:nitroreductase